MTNMPKDVAWPGNEWPDPKSEHPAIDPESQSNEPGSTISQIPGKTGGDTYGGLIEEGPEDPEDQGDR
jgi:hypothetical protein